MRFAKISWFNRFRVKSFGKRKKIQLNAFDFEGGKVSTECRSRDEWPLIGFIRTILLWREKNKINRILKIKSKVLKQLVLLRFANQMRAMNDTLANGQGQLTLFPYRHPLDINISSVFTLLFLFSRCDSLYLIHRFYLPLILFSLQTPNLRKNHLFLFVIQSNFIYLYHREISEFSPWKIDASAILIVIFRGNVLFFLRNKNWT